MKNKKRKNSLFCYKGINLALPISTAAFFSVLSILSIVFSEGVYRFHFLLMPRGAFPMPILIITFITSIGLIGGGAGMFIIDRNYRKCKEKVAAVLSASLLSVIMNIWYNF